MNASGQVVGISNYTIDGPWHAVLWLTCTPKKLSLAGEKALSKTKRHAKAVGKRIAPDGECLAKADEKFSEGWMKADAAGDCLNPTRDESEIEDKVDAFLDDVVTDLVNAPGPSRCTSRKLTLAGKEASSLSECHAKAASEGVAADPACLQEGDGQFHDRLEEGRQAAGLPGTHRRPRHHRRTRSTRSSPNLVSELVP